MFFARIIDGANGIYHRKVEARTDGGGLKSFSVTMAQGHFGLTDVFSLTVA